MWMHICNYIVCVCVHIQEDDDLCNKLNICNSSATAATLELKQVGVYVTCLMHIMS